MTGLNLTHYRIDSELGRGGMGIVYLATDTKLNRKVALKVLPPSALASEDDRARFFREAQAAAQLHHPNIATVFQIDEAVPLSDEGKVVEGHTEKRPFIAMEYVEGETLSDHIKKGPVKLHEGVNIAGQVAEALKAAHAKDIVHRDIKSANVMLTPDGVAKVLDFGLAKTNQSTMLTRMGSTLGTVAYMSPEQARGQEVDGRTDLYALGTMLYEMVAGRLPFAGDYEQAVLYSILNEPPEPLTALRTGVPMELERIIAKLLSKEAEYRYQSAAGLLADLKSLDLTGSGVSRASMSAVSGVGVSGAPEPTRAMSRFLWPAIAVAALAGGLILGPVIFGGEPDPAESMRFEIHLPGAIPAFRPAWSPGGAELYYLAQDDDDSPRYVRRYSLASGASVRIPGTDDVADVHVSPDGRWLVVFDQGSRQYRRALRSGGEFSDIRGAESPAEWGGYAPDGRFYFTTPAFDIASVGESGDVVRHTERDSTVDGLVAPLFFEGGSSVFASDWLTRTRTNGTVRLVDGPPGFEWVSREYAFLDLFENGHAMMVPAGPTDQPMAVAPVNKTTGQIEGPVVPVARMEIFGFSVSPNGHLIYREQVTNEAPDDEPLYRVESGGTLAQIAGALDNSDDFYAARTRNAVVMESNTQPGSDLYVVNLDSGVSTRLTRGGDNQYAEWSPDDRYVYWRSIDDLGIGKIMRRRSDASEPAEVVLFDSLGGGSVYHPAITADGSVLLFTWSKDGNASKLYKIDLGEPGSMDLADAQVISESDGPKFGPYPSPDNRYVVFRSESALVVSSLTGQGVIELTGEGREAVWSPDGQWIYFLRSTSRQAYRIPVATDPVFAITGPEELVFESVDHIHLSIHADGTPLVSTIEPGRVSDAAGSRIWMVLNFQDEATRMAPRDR